MLNKDLILPETKLIRAQLSFDWVTTYKSRPTYFVRSIHWVSIWAHFKFRCRKPETFRCLRIDVTGPITYWSTPQFDIDLIINSTWYYPHALSSRWAFKTLELVFAESEHQYRSDQKVKPRGKSWWLGPSCPICAYFLLWPIIKGPIILFFFYIVGPSFQKDTSLVFLLFE